MPRTFRRRRCCGVRCAESSKPPQETQRAPARRPPPIQKGISPMGTVPRPDDVATTFRKRRPVQHKIGKEERAEIAQRLRASDRFKRLKFRARVAVTTAVREYLGGDG